jgi:hypothetical protein
VDLAPERLVAEIAAQEGGLERLASSAKALSVGCWMLARVKRRRIVSGSAVRSAIAVV